MALINGKLENKIIDYEISILTLKTQLNFDVSLKERNILELESKNKKLIQENLVLQKKDDDKRKKYECYQFNLIEQKLNKEIEEAYNLNKRLVLI